MSPTPTKRLLIFDLGGVLIDWDPRHLYRKLFHNDAAGMELFLREICSPDWNRALDAGRPFADAVAELSRAHPQKRQLIEAYHTRWIEMIGGPIEASVALLEELKRRRHPMVALTNWASETFELVRHEAAYSFLNWFERVFVSGEIGLIKPDPALFEMVRDELPYPPESCYFIDDSEANVVGAKKVGWQAHRFTNADGLRAWLVGEGFLD